MKQRGKAVTAGCILLALLAGVGFTKAGSKYRTQEEVNLIFSNVTSNSAKQSAEKFKELVEEYSGGKMTVDVFQDNQLGDDKTAAEGVQNGDIDIAVSSTSSLSTLYKDYYLYDTPYLFLNKEEVYDVGFTGETATKMLEGVEGDWSQPYAYGVFRAVYSHAAGNGRRRGKPHRNYFQQPVLRGSEIYFFDSACLYAVCGCYES